MVSATITFAQKVQIVSSGNTYTHRIADGTQVQFIAAQEPEEPGTLVAVDLGLESGTKWANMNIGASLPADYGSYFMWGHKEDCSAMDCSRSNCKTYKVNIEQWQGNNEYDAATANWGNSWQTPTRTQIEELVSNCNWSWTTQQDSKGNEVSGYKVSSKTNDNSIFFPAAGYRYDTGFSDQGSYGYYWSSSPYESITYSAYGLYFFSGYQYVSDRYRHYAFPVRPVSAQQ